MLVVVWGLGIQQTDKALTDATSLEGEMREALRIQDRFAVERLFAKTGRGYLQGERVVTLNKLKSNLRRKAATKSK